MKVQIAVFDGFDEIDVFGTFEPLAVAGVDVELARPGSSGQVRSARGVRVEVDTVLGDESDVDGIVVPGGGWLNRAAEGAWAEVQRGELPARLVELRARVPWLASVCAGGMVLAHAGLLAGRSATTNRNCYDEFRPLVGELVDARVVDDGDLITAGALTSGLDLGLHLVQRFLGQQAAEQASRALEYPAGAVWSDPTHVVGEGHH